MEALEKPSRSLPHVVGYVRSRFRRGKSLNDDSQMIVHDTSLKACPTFTRDGCGGGEEWRGGGCGLGPNRWTTLAGSEVGIGQCVVPGWLALRLGRRVITPSRRHYAQP